MRTPPIGAFGLTVPSKRLAPQRRRVHFLDGVASVDVVFTEPRIQPITGSMSVRRVATLENSEGSVWSRHRAETTRRIERATLTLCGEKGIGGVTVDDIAAAVGISRRTFYRYFETIDDVLSAAPRRSLDRVCRGIRERPPSESIRQAFVRGAYKWGPSEEEQEYHVLAMRIVKRDPEAWDRAMSRVQAASRQAFETLTAERLRNAAQNPAYAPIIVTFLLAAIGHVVTQVDVGGRRMTDAEDLDRVLGELTEIISS